MMADFCLSIVDGLLQYEVICNFSFMYTYNENMRLLIPFHRAFLLD